MPPSFHCNPKTCQFQFQKKKKKLTCLRRRKVEARLLCFSLNNSLWKTQQQKPSHNICHKFQSRGGVYFPTIWLAHEICEDPVRPEPTGFTRRNEQGLHCGVGSFFAAGNSFVAMSTGPSWLPPGWYTKYGKALLYQLSAQIWVWLSRWSSFNQAGRIKATLLPYRTASQQMLLF